MNASLKRKGFLDFFPVPEFLLLSNTGIAITDNTTSFVQLRREYFGNRFELVHATKVDNPKGAVVSGLVSQSSLLTPVLTKLASHYKVQYVNAILPEERAYLFTVTIDWVSLEGLKDAVAFIIEENAPVVLAESIFSYEIIEEDRVGGKINLAVSVISKDIVNSYTELFESMGVTPVAFRLASQAIARTVISPDDKQAQLIINISKRKTGFYIVKNNVVHFSTTVPYGIGDDEVPSNVNDLRVEMRKVLAFWNVHNEKPENSDGVIKKAVVCGIGAGKKEFVTELMNESGVEYTFADIWLNLSPKHHIKEMTFEESLNFAFAVGLILTNKR